MVEEFIYIFYKEIIIPYEPPKEIIIDRDTLFISKF